MKKIVKQVAASMISAVLLSGCAIKQTDSDAMRVTKHVINSPVYVLAGIGFVAQSAMAFTVAPVSMPIRGIVEGLRDGNQTDNNTAAAVDGNISGSLSAVEIYDTKVIEEIEPLEALDYPVHDGYNQ